MRDRRRQRHELGERWIAGDSGTSSSARRRKYVSCRGNSGFYALLPVFVIVDLVTLLVQAVYLISQLPHAR